MFNSLITESNSEVLKTAQRILEKISIYLLSHVSCVRLCATPQTTAHQAPPSLGFSRQEHWSGLPFPSPMHKSEKVKMKTFSHVQLLATPCTAAYQAPPSMGFFQARVLEWVAISFSRRSSQPRDRTQVSRIAGRRFTI